MIKQDLAELSSLLIVNGKSLVEFTADNMRRLSLSYQLKNNPKFHQLLTEVLQKIEETAKNCQFKLRLTVPNNSDDEKLYEQVCHLLQNLGYCCWISDKFELDGENAKNNYFSVEWDYQYLPF